MFEILLVEDDKNTSRWMKEVLTHNGYNVIQAYDGYEALDLMETKHIDLIVLDVMLPRMDGFQLAQELRSCQNNTPILMVTAKQSSQDKIKGFLAGTDDYMTKPVNEEEMLLRIKAIMRRYKIATEHKLKVGDILLDYDSLSVCKDGEVQTLPQKEFYLLFKLLSSPDTIFTRLQLMDEIWGMESNTVDTTVNVHINRLRKRFEGWDEFEIKAIRGIGYKAVIHETKS